MSSALENVVELLRLPSPAPKPQALAFDGTLLWMGSRETCRLYAINAATWAAHDETVAPGIPWGMVVVGDELRVVCGEGADDDRFVRRYVPGHGFKSEGSFPCPDSTGSQLGYDGDRLYLSQWYNKRILSLDEHGHVGTIVDVPHGICGQVVVDGRFYLVTTDDESSGEYWLTRVDARGTTPRCDDIARIPFDARSLAFDGERFWTNHREADQIVAFARPDA
jgi:hypothetical protein